MQPEKKQLEILLIDYFRNTYSEFPKGRVVSSESPDFWVKLKSKNILGIELTRLNPANAETPDKQRQNEIFFRETLIENTREIFERSAENTLFVKFLFSEKQKIETERSMAVSVRLAGLIRNTVAPYKKEIFFAESLNRKVLPKGLEEVLVIQHPKLEKSVWERSNNLGLSNNVVDDIKRAIQKKDEKLNLYHKSHLNYYWLLITTDRLRGIKNVNLTNKILNHKFESSFQHVFLFDLIKSDIYRLI